MIPTFRQTLLSILIPFTLSTVKDSHAMSSSMKYVNYKAGGPENLEIQATDLPTLRHGEVLMKVYATAINRADVLQRKGLYPPPPGESEILGLEAAGIIEKHGPGCSQKWKLGDRVMALLAGGGYAEYVAVPEATLLCVPTGMAFTTAAAIPEVWLTAYQLMHIAGELKKGDTVLIHAGGSGVGTAAVQLAALAGAKPIVTAGSEAKINTAKQLGALAGFNYKEGDFSNKVLEFTNGSGVDLLLDCIGESFYEQNMKSIRTDGRWVLYGLLGEGNVNGDLFRKLLSKRIRITGTTLRTRSIEFKKNLTDSFATNALPLFEENSQPHLKPIIDSVHPFRKVVDTHKLMESNQNTGKVVLQIRNEETGAVLHDEF